MKLRNYKYREIKEKLHRKLYDNTDKIYKFEACKVFPTDLIKTKARLSPLYVRKLNYYKYQSLIIPNISTFLLNDTYTQLHYTL